MLDGNAGKSIAGFVGVEMAGSEAVEGAGAAQERFRLAKTSHKAGRERSGETMRIKKGRNIYLTVAGNCRAFPLLPKATNLLIHSVPAPLQSICLSKLSRLDQSKMAKNKNKIVIFPNLCFICSVLTSRRCMLSGVGNSMESLENIVLRAQSGDAEAYEIIFQRFKGMALSYAYSILGDYQLAEDAKQEAFIGAYCDLLALRNPAAFPGWFRTVVRKHSIQIKRGRKTLNLPLENADEVLSNDANPAQQAQTNEISRHIAWGIDQLPEHERDVTRLFYLKGNSLKEISSIIDLP
jgi:RNA polymerase sigma factor (sigma-70 family)